MKLASMSVSDKWLTRAKLESKPQGHLHVLHRPNANLGSFKPQMGRASLHIVY